MPSTARRSLILVPLLGLCWGLNWTAVRIALDEIPPWTLRTFGPALAAMLLMVVARMVGQPLAVPRAHWPRLVLATILSLALVNVLGALAQLSGSTSRAAIVVFTMPVWAVLLARVSLGEALDSQRLLGLALGIAGLAVLTAPLFLTGSLTIGLLYALLAAISWALGTIVIKRWPVAAPALAVAAWQLAIASVFAGIGMLIFEGLPVPRPISLRVIGAIAYQVLIAQGLAYALWLVIVSQVPAGIASLGTLMVPAIGVCGAVLFLGERPGLSDWIGLVLVVAASATILLPRSEPAPA